MKKWIYIAIFILTIGDALFTTLGVKEGVIEEANPLLQNIFHASPECAASMIVLGVGLFLLLIYKYQYRIPWIKYALVGLFFVKVGVLGLHFNWMAQVI